MEPVNSFNSMQNLAARWYRAAHENIGTTERMKLYSDTREVVEYLGKGVRQVSKVEGLDISNLCELLLVGYDSSHAPQLKFTNQATYNPNAREENAIYDLCKALIQGFNQSDESKTTLANWVAHNTSRGAENGAYLPLHHLFDALERLEPENCQALKIIDSQALEINNKLNSGIPHNIVEPLLHSQNNLKDFLEMAKTSKGIRGASSPIIDIFINKLNKGEISLNDLGIKTLTAFCNFFGNRCSEITRLDLRGLKDIKDTDIQLIFDSFPDISQLYLNQALITDKATVLFLGMPKLTNLELSNCPKVSDFTILGHLKKLKELCLSKNSQITNLKFLEELQELEKLDLSGSNIKCIPQSLIMLTSLNLSECRIHDINFLQTLENLETLDLSQNLITDIRILESLKKLKKINLSGCRLITDCSSLKGLHSLTNLNLGFCFQISDFSFLKNLQTITHLNLQSCTQIKDINFLESMTKLIELNLSNFNRITDLSPLQFLKELENLSFSGCVKITDIESIISLKKLRTLDLSRCKGIKDFSMLKNLQGLKRLSLSNCTQISDISFVQDLKRLTYLHLLGCEEITNITHLQSLEELTFLNLSYCEKITDISVLSRLNELKELSVGGCCNTVLNQGQELQSKGMQVTF